MLNRSAKHDATEDTRGAPLRDNLKPFASEAIPQPYYVG